MRSPPIWNLAWWLGFGMTVNLFLVPGVDQSPRITDLTGVVLGLWLLMQAHRRGLPALPLAAIAVANLLPLLWATYSLYTREMSTLVESTRWLLALPWALALLWVVSDETSRCRFAWGLATGCAVNTAIVVMQFLGWDGLLRPLGIAATDADFQHYWAGHTRLSGLHRHHAATAAVTSLLAPSLLYLYLRRRRGVWLPLVGLGLIAVTLHLTFTRSPLGVTVLTLMVGLVAARQFRRTAVLGALLLAVAIPALIWIGPPGGKARWDDSLSMEANVGERLLSSAKAFEISLENPQGLGVSGGQDALISATAMRATHNAFFQASLHLGMPLALALFVAIVHLMSSLLQGSKDPDLLLGLVAVHLFGLFLFEEHLNNPTFVILASWMIVGSARRLSGQRSLGGGWPRNPTRTPA